MGKKDIINDIEKVVQNGNFDDGKILVNEYKKNFCNDSKIASVEAAINFYEGKLNKALEVVKEGLRFNLLESDLYSIMGSIYESKCEYNRAYLCYEQALYLCADDEKKDYIMKNIYKLNSNCDIQINNVSFIILTSDNLENIKNCINSI
ncbi:MAG: tetratricopeptide repeat protein, partial [Clostridiales bacterium]|nr:tetratricopeptide repeat protein [Clostridiales bacterium]